MEALKSLLHRTTLQACQRAKEKTGFRFSKYMSFAKTIYSHQFLIELTSFQLRDKLKVVLKSSIKKAEGMFAKDQFL
jgi:hypothetical protein